jgi:hypothetical protein
MRGLVPHAQRVEVGGEVAADPSTACFTASSETLTPFSAALALILSPAPFASAGSGCGHMPSSAAVSSSLGCGGQSLRAQEGPAASAFTARSSSPRVRKNSAQASSTDFGSLA